MLCGFKGIVDVYDFDDGINFSNVVIPAFAGMTSIYTEVGLSLRSVALGLGMTSIYTGVDDMKKRNKKKGQVSFEMALLIVAMIGMTKLVQVWAVEIELFGKFLIEPWKQVKVMMESGVWRRDVNQGRELHPTQANRLYSLHGETP